MQSPWINGSQGEQYQVPGLAALLMQRNADTATAMGNMGTFFGALASGGVGAQQASQDPSAFGAGTSPASAAVQGGLMNFSNAYGGGAGGDLGSFSRMVRGGGGGTVTGTGGTNFKQFEAMGKMADATRDAMASTTPSLPDQQPAVMGYTDDQWKHLGTADKVQALAATKQAMEMKAAQQGYQAGQMDLAAKQQQLAAQQRQAAAWARFGQNYTAQATTPGAGVGAPSSAPDPTGMPGSDMFGAAPGAAAPSSGGGTLSGQQMYDMAIRSGVAPQDALELAKGAMDVEKGQADLSREDKDRSPSNWTNPTTGRNYTIMGNSILPSKDDDELAGEARIKASQANATARLGAITKSIEDIDKLPSSQRNSADNVGRRRELVAEQRGLLTGASASGVDLGTATPSVQVDEHPTVNTRADFDKLPRGATYRGKDGSLYQKP